MKKSLVAAMFVLVAATVAAGVAILNSKARPAAEPAYDASGMMREVVVMAEASRLVMPTVHVSASRALASLPASPDLN